MELSKEFLKFQRIGTFLSPDQQVSYGMDRHAKMSQSNYQPDMVIAG